MEAELRALGRNLHGLEDHAALLRSRLRAGRVTLAQVRCASYLGDEAAQLVEPLGVRVGFVPGLAAHLDLPGPLGLMGPCEGSEFGDHHGPCGGRAEIPLSPDPLQYYSVLIAEAVGRQCGEIEHKEGCEPMLCTVMCIENFRALEAARVWLRSPTGVNRAATNALVNPPRDRPSWSFQPLRMVYAWDGAAQQGLWEALDQALCWISMKEIREAALRAMRPHLGLTGE